MFTLIREEELQDQEYLVQMRNKLKCGMGLSS